MCVSVSVPVPVPAPVYVYVSVSLSVSVYASVSVSISVSWLASCDLGTWRSSYLPESGACGRGRPLGVCGRHVLRIYIVIPVFTGGQFWPSGIGVAYVGLFVCPCGCVCVCVCMYVHQPQVCPRKKLISCSSLIHQIRWKDAKVKIPINFGVDWPWPSKWNSTLKSNITPFCVFPRENSPCIKVRISEFRPEIHLSTVKIPIDLSLIDFDLQFHFQFWNLAFYQTCCFVLYLVRPLFVNISETIAGEIYDNRNPVLSVLWSCVIIRFAVNYQQRYCNRFIHLGRPIFSVNHSGASLYIQSRLRMRACAIRYIVSWHGISKHPSSTFQLSMWIFYIDRQQY